MVHGESRNHVVKPSDSAFSFHVGFSDEAKRTGFLFAYPQPNLFKNAFGLRELLFGGEEKHGGRGPAHLFRFPRRLHQALHAGLSGHQGKHPKPTDADLFVLPFRLVIGGIPKFSGKPF